MLEIEELLNYPKEEDLFVEQYGGYKFFNGGDAEAQYVYLRLKADGWIR